MSRRDGISLVDGERHAIYGDAGSMWANIARAWSGVLGYTITPKQAVLCMAAMKLVRENYQHNDDNLRDAHGYVEIAERLETAGKWDGVQQSLSWGDGDAVGC